MIEHPVTEEKLGTQRAKLVKCGERPKRYGKLMNRVGLGGKTYEDYRQYQVRALCVIDGWVGKLQETSLKAIAEKKGAEWETAWATARALLKVMLTEFVVREKQRGSQ